MKQIEPRVLHVNDCASVGLTLVTEATKQGLPWELQMPTPRRAHPVLTALERGSDVWSIRRRAESYSLLHVHYGLMSYYAMWAGKPFVLHLHGSDLRRDLHSGGLRERIVRWGLRHARHVFYSTPDMEREAVALRRDATWLPAPVAHQFLEAPSQSGACRTRTRRRVLFCSRWDIVKGAHHLLHIADEIRRNRPDVELVGLNFGNLRSEAKDTGISMVPVVSRDRFPSFLRSFDVVVGQMRAGAFGVTELESLASGVPVVMPFRYADRYATRPPVDSCDPEHVPEVVLNLLEDDRRREELGIQSVEFVRKYHSPNALVALLRTQYNQCA